MTRKRVLIAVAAAAVVLGGAGRAAANSAVPAAGAPATVSAALPASYSGTVRATETYHYSARHLDFTATATSTSNLVMPFLGRSPGGTDYTSELSQSTWTVTYSDQAAVSGCTENGHGTGTQATAPFNFPASLIIPDGGPPTLSAGEIINVSYTGNCASDPRTGPPLLLGGWDACPYNPSKASPGRILPGGKLRFNCSRDFTIPGLPPGHGHITITGTFIPGPATASPIVCRIKAHNPHNSGHQPANINATADVRCTSPITSIEMDTELTRDHHTVGANTVRNNHEATLNSRIFVPCVKGTYVGTAQADLEFPPLYHPPAATIGHASRAVAITC